MNADYNLLVILCSFLVSVAGSFMALVTVRNAINTTNRKQKFILVALAAIALGGVGIWSMHFIGMQAMNLNAPVSYDMGITLLSMLIAIGFVFLGFTAIRQGKPSIIKLIATGVIVGSGVTAMHYSGMMAMEGVAISWNPDIVAVSYAIAVVASIVALWLAANLVKTSHMILSAFVMGIAVCGMHYTGMFAADFTVTATASNSQQLQANNIIMVGSIALAAALILTVVSVANALLGKELLNNISSATPSHA